jgi:hypothetical protein
LQAVQVVNGHCLSPLVRFTHIACNASALLPTPPQVVSGDGLSYYFDGHHLFVKLVDPGNQETQVGQLAT